MLAGLRPPSDVIDNIFWLYLDGNRRFWVEAFRSVMNIGCLVENG